MDIRNLILNHNKRATARLISMVENKDPEGLSILQDLYVNSGKAYVVGITGPPGAGKSTLTDKLTKHLRSQGKEVAIIAVDPTSPFTGGAILGDRVRMNDLTMDSGVFIRSMGARGHLGGISEATAAAVKILDIYGADFIFVETVGVGQSEIDIVKNCDTTLMVMVPGLGDDIQAIKAGVMEIGDVFAVNKADREGANRTAREIDMMLDFNKTLAWRPPVKQVVASENKGIPELMNEILRHKDYLESSGEFAKKRVNNAKSEVLEMIKERIEQSILDKSQNEETLNRYAQQIAQREMDPFQVVDILFDSYKSSLKKK